MSSISNVLVSSLEQRWQNFLSELRRCKRSFSEESVHDLRVATRRLVSTLAILEVILPDDRIRRTRRRLKRLFDALSPLRDVQVQLLTVEEKSRQYPGLETLITVLKVRERLLMKSIDSRIRKIHTVQWSYTIRSLKKEIRLQFSNPVSYAGGRTAAQGAAAAAFTRAMFRREQIIPGDPRSLHRFRVAFKKFRYTMEALQPLFSSVRKKNLKAMDAYQTRLGNIQDAEVLGRRVARYALSRPPTIRRALTGYRREQEQEKRKLIAAFLKSADELYGFWKRPFSAH